MIVGDDLFFNILKDWEKRDITTEEKGEFCRAYLADKKISEREFSRRFGIPKSTLHDWISGRQMKKYYFKKENEIFSLADRLTYLIGKLDGFDDRTKRKLLILYNELEKCLK